MSTGLKAITAALNAANAHNLRSLMASGSLSQIVCSCGEVFTPSPAGTPKEWSTLPALHRALRLAEAVASDMNLPYLADLTEVSSGSVFLGSDGRLYRLLATDEWIDQDGRIHKESAVALLTLTLIWAPTA